MQYDALQSEMKPGQLLDSFIPNVEAMRALDFDVIIREVDSNIKSCTEEIYNIIRRISTDTIRSSELESKVTALSSEIKSMSEALAESRVKPEGLVPDAQALVAEKAALDHEVSTIEKAILLNSQLRSMQEALHTRDYAHAYELISSAMSIRAELSSPEAAVSADTAVPPLIEQLLHRQKILLEEAELHAKDELAALSDCEGRDEAELSRGLCNILALLNPALKDKILEESYRPRLTQYSRQFSSWQDVPTRVYRKENAVREIDSFQKREHWLRSVNLKVRQFPPEWRAAEYFMQQFASLTRQHLTYILDSTNDELKYESFCLLLAKIKSLEAAMGELAGDPARFACALTKMLDAFTQPWYRHVNQQLQSAVAKAFSSADNIVEAPGGGVPQTYTQPKSIHESALKLVRAVAQMIQDCERYGVNQMAQDALILLEKNLQAYLDVAVQQTQPLRLVFAREVDAIRPLLHRSYTPVARDSVLRYLAELGASAKPASAKPASGEDRDFGTLAQVNATIDFLWQSVVHLTREKNASPLSASTSLQLIWDLRTQLYLSLVSHFIISCAAPAGAAPGSAAQLYYSWQSWISETQQCVSPAFADIVQSHLMQIVAEVVADERDSADVARIVNWLPTIGLCLEADLRALSAPG